MPKEIQKQCETKRNRSILKEHKTQWYTEAVSDGAKIKQVEALTEKDNK